MINLIINQLEDPVKTLSLEYRIPQYDYLVSHTGQVVSKPNSHAQADTYQYQDGGRNCNLAFAGLIFISSMIRQNYLLDPVQID